ncbi:filamentous haemagglutinin family protein [Methylobacter sp.]|uniref:filamentous haemagglutinin family protein n=1 Tax=Methylobacter sp. TaxID=2051955 RepID=UPI001217BB35|nr:filamentous haemagglutinin family protein [Methylobacter sp.]TAK65339.1 MAG: filamentous hemagglutinin N-terminal domain-containing protein [Methylobacter sp.]
MSHKKQLATHKPVEDVFRLKPLVACMRLVITSGLFASIVAPVHAELPVPMAGWVGAGSATNQVIGDTLRIDQQTDRAILNWQSFNVGRENTVQFVQPGASSIALNRIYDKDPSQILGQIVANGQVYLYNQNGFVFGKDSVVNANSLLASTLNITDEVFNRGITRVFDENGSAALVIEPMKPGATMDPKTAKILIEAGAKIHTDKAGRIIIAAPTIENKGSLSSDEQGQIILAASQDKVYLQAASKDSPFAGLVVEVDTGGKVTNAGDILARQGNITMAGFAVNQEGRVSATTSVNVNGSIRLLAQEQHGSLGGKLVATKTTRAADNNDGLGTKAKLTFGSGSVTQIVADNDGATAIVEQNQPSSYLEAKAHTVELKSNSAIVVPHGRVDITATDNLGSPTQGTSGRIYMEKDALIDVSGYKGVIVPMERNVGEISVQSYELRDAPLQKTGVLKGETIRVDLRKDTKIVDTSGALARIKQGIDERLGEGGEINLTSSGDVIINDGAKIDISGGSVDYQDGYISTTKLLTDYNRIVDISDADPNEHYMAIFGVIKEVHRKWGIERVWDIQNQFGLGQFEQGYRQGNAAGSINIHSPNLIWNGDLTAGSDAGRYQRLPGKRPDGGRFLFDSTVVAASSLQNIRFQTEKGLVPIGLEDSFPVDADNKPEATVLSTQLTNQSGVQHLTVKTRGEAIVAGGTNLQMVPGGEFSLQAADIDVQGQIHAASGSINLAIAENLSGEVNLGASSTLDVSGRWVNDLMQDSTAAPVDPLYLDGGSIKVSSLGDLFLQAGSKVIADGGAWLAQNSKLTAGKGGAIELAAVGNGVASTIHLDGEVSAASLSEGGSLTLSSGEIVVGSAPSKTADPLILAVNNGHFAFDPESSFGEINLVGNFEGVTVASDTSLDLETKNLLFNDNFRDKPSDSSIREFAGLELLPEHLRQPFQLSLDGNTDVTVATGSSITTDKQSTVNLVSRLGGVYVDGTIATPGGKINLSIIPASNSEYDPSQSIRLGTHAQLLAQGTTRLKPLNALGQRSGDVLDGGQVVFGLKRGYLIAEKDSLIDVSGTHTVLDLPQTENSGLGVANVPVDVASNAGSIAMTVAEGAVLDGNMRGIAGSDSARAGRFSLKLDNTDRKPPDEPKVAFPNNPLLIRVRENQQQLFNAGIQFGDNIPGEFNGQAVVAADALEAGGFSDMRLSTPDEIRFEGNVGLTAKARLDLDSGKIGWTGLNGETTGAVNLNTALLRMGSSQQREVSSLPVAGAGQFNANAQWIELFGASRWDNFSQINLDSAHDLRTVGLRSGSQREFLGAMVTAANLNLHASQIYPTTLSKFTFAVKNNPNGQINIAGSNTDNSPLSAAGELTFEAPVINQSGVIKAPLGTINLKAGSKLTLAENSLTSVSAAGQVIPFGVTQGGLDWLYPLDIVRNLVFNTPPEKKLVLQAPEVILAKGSTVDLSGGGDLYGYEFQPGSGGSYDYLKPGSDSYQGGFAVVPNLGSDLAPFDHYQYADWGVEPGSKVYLSGSADLPAGEYTILPAHYALLPGAFLVTPQAKTQDQNLTTYTKQGLPVVPGFQTVAGTDTRDARWSGFRIESGADIRLRSQYEEHLANDFYIAKALKNETAVPVLPMDSGQISIIAQNKLVLDSTFMVDAMSGGRGAKMDIAADKIQVVNQLSEAPDAGTLEILADDLSALKIDSLMLGGARNRNTNTGATDVNVTAKEVIFSANSKVHVSDMIAAATDLLEVQSGASLAASGQVNSGDSILNLNGDGALLRISGDKQVILNRTNAPGAKGELRVAAGSTLTASESMLLDASKSTTLTGDILMHGGSLNLSANAINMGDVAGLAGNDLNLTNQKLLNLSVDELVLNSRGTVGFYGNIGQVDGSNNPILGDDGLQAPIKFDRLVINGSGFSGFGSSGQAARLQANNLLLANPQNAAATTTGTGQGRLDLLATNFTQGAGTFDINGFNAVNVIVNKGFNADGKSILNVASDLTLNVGYLTTTGGSNLKLDAGGHTLHVNGNGSAVSEASSGFGGAMEFIADSVAFDANALLPSGNLNLHALVGDVAVGSSANIDLAGRAVKFADKIDYTPGGTFSAIADNGAVTLASGSKLDLSTGGGLAAGGNLVLKAPKQTVTLAGQIKASAGSAEFDVSTYSASSGFNSLMDVLKNAGISDSIYFRSRDADIIQAASSVIDANKITLVSDNGAIELFGQLRANGVEQGGKISVFAGDSIILENGAELTAKGTKGGEVLLSSVDSDNDNLSGINLKTGSLIDVSGATEEKGGEVTLRALRDGNGIKIQPIAGLVQGYANKSPVYDANDVLTEYGYSNFYAEGVRKYVNAGLGNDGEINTTDIATIKADTDDYMTAANMQSVTDTLGNYIRLRAGVEINYDGDLKLADKWDFADWRYNEGTGLIDLPGNLSVSATGKITLNASISDGFKDGFIYFDSLQVKDLLQAGDSWSYQVTAGSDLTSADRLATSTENDLVIGADVSVRTGSGDMHLVSGGNIIFTDETSTVYSAGKPTDTDRYGTLYADTVGFVLYAEYPVQGGDLVLKAGKDIQGAETSQFISPWLLRQGNWTDNANHNGETPTAWGVALGYTTDLYGNAADSSSPLFKQNIGSFGGGKVEVIASGNIKDLSVMMPTTGKQIGQPVFDPNVPQPPSYDFINNKVQVNGGGEMRISAGGDIAGGAYFLGQGQGSLSANGAIKGGSQFTAGPQLVMGDAQFELQSKKDLSLTGVSDPMMLEKGSGNTKFFSYSDTSAVSVRSLSGDVHLGANATKLAEILGFGNNQKTLAEVYPASLLATAFGGSVILDKAMISNNALFLFPSAKGALNVLAEQDIRSNGEAIRLGMSDADKTLFPTALSPRNESGLGDSATRIKPNGLANLVHAATPVHAGDNEPARLVTRQGDIKNIQFNLAKQALIHTGRDFANVQLDIQHPNQNDVSILDVGRDLRYDSDRGPDGDVLDNTGEIKVSGAGEVLVKTGRHFDLGASVGLSTIGNLVNTGLEDRGANITVISGLNGGNPNYAGFIGKYLENSSLYAADFAKASNLITGFMRQRSGNAGLSADEALAGFKSLQAEDYLAIEPQLNALILPVYMNEIRESGSASASGAGLANERGYAAIESLFPGTQWSGDLTLFFSKIQTLDGGGINMLVPGGKVNAGLAVSITDKGPKKDTDKDKDKDASDLGIVAQKDGAINAVVRDDFLVNQSRVFSLDGDDITLWSSTGDLDAGRGAKSAIAAPPPNVSFDENGNLVIEFPPIVSGSGIRTAASSAGVVPGDVFLFAPKGVVDAGEAGIGGTNVTISATAVLGASNIQVSGVSTGVPVASTGSVAAGLTGTSNVTANASQVAQATTGMDDNNSSSKNVALGMLSVEVLGFGE